MKLAILAITALTVTMANTALATPYPHHNPKKILVRKTSATGSNISVDIHYLDSILSDLAMHARSYPPQFDNDEDRIKAIRDVRSLDYMLSVIDQTQPGDAEMLLRHARINSMGYNLDVSGSGNKAEQLFQTVLNKAPDNPQVNYYYGLFLASAGKADKAIPLLHKAADGKLYDAYYNLGLVYLSLNNTEQALSYLQKYQQLTPHHADTRKIIETIQSGQSNLQHN